MDISREVKRLLKEKKISHKKLAEMLGVTAQRVSQMMVRENEYTLAVLIKIAEILDVSVAYLCRNDDEIIIKANVKKVIEFTDPTETVRVEKENGEWIVKAAE